MVYLELTQIFGEESWFQISSANGSSNIHSKFSKTKIINIHPSNSVTDNNLEVFTATRLTLLNKNPRARPIDVREVLRRIAGEVIM